MLFSFNFKFCRTKDVKSFLKELQQIFCLYFEEISVTAENEDFDIVGNVDENEDFQQ